MSRKDKIQFMFSKEFSMEFGVLSGSKLLLSALRDDPRIVELIDDLRYDIGLQIVLREEVERLAADAVDLAYQNPNDVGLCAGLWALVSSGAPGVSETCGVLSKAPNTHFLAFFVRLVGNALRGECDDSYPELGAYINRWRFVSLETTRVSLTVDWETYRELFEWEETVHLQDEVQETYRLTIPAAKRTTVYKGCQSTSVWFQTDTTPRRRYESGIGLDAA